MSEAILDIYENVSTQNNKTAPLLSLKHISYSYNTPKAEIPAPISAWILHPALSYLLLVLQAVVNQPFFL